ncbi:MAG: hypothetical protein KDC53_03410, partial [Saprospiraceae bacterium]|nr:hypothetical protein [Saprospiraceae bacterium]
MKCPLVKYTLIFLVAILTSSLNGQVNQRWNVPVLTMDGSIIPNALAGGFNSPQFSNIYLNEDTLVDLFVFDRSGWKNLTFLSDPSLPGSFIYAPEYENSFPELQ